MSNFVVDGIEITSEHIGKKLEVVETNNSTWLPVGFVATIRRICDYEIKLEDNGGEGSHYYITDSTLSDWVFKWVDVPTPKPKQKSSKPQRQKLAKAIKEAKKVLEEAIKSAEEVGMMVDIDNDSVKIMFQPPMEEY